jgi:predicted nucleic acid-binding protein
MLDTNIYDLISTEENFRQLLITAQEIGLITLYETHVQQNEVEKMPDTKSPQRDRIQKVIAVSCREISTTTAIWDHSEWDKAQWGPGQFIDQMGYTDSRGVFKNPKNIEDALIADTALAKMDILITNDRAMCRNASRATQQCNVMSSVDFKEFLDNHINEKGTL